MPISGKKIVRILLSRGWSIQSQRGSHVKLMKEGKVTTVPVHGSRDLGIGLIRAIERQTGERLL
jgi:predicted RNA binding protein YcfA (HicA-like mRNA interferase family)